MQKLNITFVGRIKDVDIYLGKPQKSYLFSVLAGGCVVASCGLFFEPHSAHIFLPMGSGVEGVTP